MAFDPNFPPINQSDWLPWNSPTYIPGSPHNLPSANDIGGASASVSPGTVPTREVYRYASLTSVAITVGVVSFKFLDQPIGKRNFLGFRNASTGGQNIYIDFNGAATTNSWIYLAPGTIVLFDTVVPQDDLYVIADIAGATLAYAYSTFAG